jgi:hypothetical protein
MLTSIRNCMRHALLLLALTTPVLPANAAKSDFDIRDIVRLASVNGAEYNDLQFLKHVLANKRVRRPEGNAK